MIDYRIAQSLREKAGLPESIFEKDYLIELVLYYIFKDTFLSEQLIFRGGTALKKIYFVDYRYSEDLDFITTFSDSLNTFINKFENLSDKINKEFPVELKVSRFLFPQKGHLQIYLSYNIVPEIRTNKELKIDLIQDNIILSNKKRNILFTYDDFKQFQGKLTTDDLESIVSDKIGRILDVVDEPRDLWDLCYLLKLKIKISKVKKIYLKKYGTSILQSNLITAIKKVNYKKYWEIRLKNQIPNLIPYEKIIKELETLIKGKFKK